MKTIVAIGMLILLASLGCTQETPKNASMEFKKLTSAEARVIINKETEAPFKGEYDDFFEDGIYTCRQCGAKLYHSEDKFHSGCGWPSFDDEISEAVKRTTDADGQRTEITCANCGGHLGHVFKGEGLTEKNIRHCVNSISMDFITFDKITTGQDTAIFAGGCFWGVEYYMQQAEGVISTDVGYIGGTTKNPDYRDVCNHTTGHAEAVRVVYDPLKTNFETLTKLFFEIHDPTQINRQGSDIGDQYRSAIFYRNEQQKKIAENLIAQLEANGLEVATKVVMTESFWSAEDYHQNYYKKKQGQPYCHVYTKRF